MLEREKGRKRERKTETVVERTLKRELGRVRERAPTSDSARDEQKKTAKEH